MGNEKTRIVEDFSERGTGFMSWLERQYALSSGPQNAFNLEEPIRLRKVSPGFATETIFPVCPTVPSQPSGC